MANMRPRHNGYFPALLDDGRDLRYLLFRIGIENVGSATGNRTRVLRLRISRPISRRQVIEGQWVKVSPCEIVRQLYKVYPDIPFQE